MQTSKPIWTDFRISAALFITALSCLLSWERINKKRKLINLKVLLLFLGKLSFVPFYKRLSATFLFNLLSKPIPSASAGLNSNNCGEDLDIAIKKVSLIEQRLIYQLRYHCCLQLITCYLINHF